MEHYSREISDMLRGIEAERHPVEDRQEKIGNQETLASEPVGAVGESEDNDVVEEQVGKCSYCKYLGRIRIRNQPKLPEIETDSTVKIKTLGASPYFFPKSQIIESRRRQN